MAAPPSLTEAVKKVDRAVARLEELQSSIARSRNRGLRPPQERLAVRQKVDVHVERKQSRRNNLLAPAAKDAKCTLPEKQLHRRCSMPSELAKKNVPLGLANKRVPDIVEAVSRNGLVSNKENVGAKKKRRKKSALPGLVELSPPVAKGLAQRRVLESRLVNVVATEQGFPSPLGSMSNVKCKENKQTNILGSVRSGSDGRPPWKNATIISTNNRHVATIAERVRPNSATMGAHHLTTGVPTRTTGAGCSELPTNRKSQNRVSLPPSRQTSKSAATSARPSPAHDDIDFVKTFCVDVRPDPNRPWRLAPKMPSTSRRPLVMFPNPAFRSYADQGTIEDMGVMTPKLQQASPKLSPFKHFQMRPLKLSSLQQQPLFETSPATIRPYLSPSKTSPRQSKLQEEEDPLAFLIGSKAPTEPALCAFDTSRSRSLKKTMKQSILVPSQNESWLSKRLSLPCSPSSRSFIKRFSLLHSSKKTNNQTYSPTKPLPSLITRLPTRTKPTSIDSLIVTPPQRLTKSLSNSTSATPLVSPLPLPPALRVLTSKTHNFQSQKLEASSHKRSSSSCHLHAEHGAHNKDQKDSSVYRSLSSRRLREIVGSTRKKALPSGFLGCNSSSVWPSMKQRSLSSCQTHAVDCTSNCTGAGPYLFKHVKGWMHNSKALGLQAHKDSSAGKR